MEIMKLGVALFSENAWVDNGDEYEENDDGEIGKLAHASNLKLPGKRAVFS